MPILKYKWMSKIIVIIPNSNLELYTFILPDVKVASICVLSKTNNERLNGKRTEGQRMSNDDKIPQTIFKNKFLLLGGRPTF